MSKANMSGPYINAESNDHPANFDFTIFLPWPPVIFYTRKYVLCKLMIA